MFEFHKASEYGVYRTDEPPASNVKSALANFPWLEDYEGSCGLYVVEGKLKDKFFFVDMRITSKKPNARPMGSFGKDVARPVFVDFSGVGVYRQDGINNRKIFEIEDHDKYSEDPNEDMERKYGLYKSELVEFIDGEFHGTVVGALLKGGVARPKKGGDYYHNSGLLRLDGCHIPTDSKLKLTPLKNTTFRADRCLIDKFPEGLDKTMRSGNSSIVFENSTINTDISNKTTGIIDEPIKGVSYKKGIQFENIRFRGDKIIDETSENTRTMLSGSFETDKKQDVEINNIGINNSGSTNKYGHYSQSRGNCYLGKNITLNGCHVRGNVHVKGATIDNSKDGRFLGIWYSGKVKDLGVFHLSDFQSNKKGQIHSMHGRLKLGYDDFEHQDTMLRFSVNDEVIPVWVRPTEEVFSRVEQLNEEMEKTLQGDVNKGMSALDDMFRLFGLNREQANTIFTNFFESLIYDEVK